MGTSGFRSLFLTPVGHLRVLSRVRTAGQVPHSSLDPKRPAAASFLTWPAEGARSQAEKFSGDVEWSLRSLPSARSLQ